MGRSEPSSLESLLRANGDEAGSIASAVFYLSTGNIDLQLRRNGAWLYLKGECSDFEGFFDQVYGVSFPAGQRKSLAVTDRHLLIDFDLPAPWGWHRGALARQAAFLGWASRFIRRHRVSIIVAINPYIHGLNAYLLSRLTGVPYGIMITRDWDFDWATLRKLAFPTVFPSRRLEKVVERFVLRNADLAIADREHYCRYAVKNGARPDRAFHSRVVVDESYYGDPSLRPNVREQLGLAGGKLLLTVCRLQPDKLPDDSIRCLALVRAQGIDARLAFAGQGEMQPELAELAASLGVKEYVHFLGAQPLSILPALMTSADAIIGGNMGYVLVEGALSETPIVTYDYEWHPEVIKHDQTGAIVPYRDLRAMAHWTARLLCEPELASRLGKAARAFALEHHDQKAAMADYRRIYAEILGRAS